MRAGVSALVAVASAALMLDRSQTATGVVALDGHERKFVMQAVHCMFNGDFGTEWAEQRGRASKLVLIGENLDEQALRDGFDSCLAG